MQEENKDPNKAINPPRWTFSKPVNQRRSSLFGMTYVKDQASVTEPDQLLAEGKYKEQMLKELKEWDNLIVQKDQHLNEVEKMRLVADETVLNEESKEYIFTGLNLFQEYLGGLEDTKRLINFYLEERMALMEAKQDLIYIINQIADEEAANIIEDALE